MVGFVFSIDGFLGLVGLLWFEVFLGVFRGFPGWWKLGVFAVFAVIC